MRCELSVPILVDEVIKYTNAKCIGLDGNRLIRAICTNTRELRDGDIFIALNSEKDSGENYIREAIAKNMPSLSTSGLDGTLYVNDTVSGLLDIANGYMQKLPRLNHTIALTGSVGKTTTKNLLHNIFDKAFNTHSTSGNFNNLIGVPLTVLSAPSETEVLICECGMNARGEISRLSRCLSPSLSIITSVGTAHIGMLGSREEILKAKCEISDGMTDGYLLYPYSVAVDNYPYTLSVSDNDTRADLFFEIIKQDEDGTVFTYQGKNISLDKCYFHLPGAHTFNCLTYAISAADLCGVNADIVQSAINNMPRDTLRFKEYKFGGLSVLDDSYNASYESVVAALKMLQARSSKFDVVFGDILELGNYSEAIHRQIGQAIATSGAERLFIVGRYADYVYKGAREKGMSEDRIYIHYEMDNLDKLGEDIIKFHTKDALLLIKASHRIGLQRLVTYFEGRL